MKPGYLSLSSFIITLVVCLNLAFPLKANAAHFDFNARCQEAYSNILSLKLDKGRQLLKEEIEKNPENLIPIYLSNYIDFFRIYVSEDDSLFNRYEGRKDVRIKQLQDGDKNSPYYLFTQAELHLQWAFTRIKFEEYVSAFFEIRKAYRLLSQNQKQHPDFLANNKSMGLLNILLGTVPGKFKFGLKIIGMTGDLDTGRKELESILNYAENASEQYIFHDETMIIYTSLLLLVEKKEKESWELLMRSGYPRADHLFSYYVATNIAMFSGHNDQAIKWSEERPKGAEFVDYPYLNLIHGLSLLNKNDKRAEAYILKFLKRYKGGHYIKHAYLKLAWNALIHDNTESYLMYIEKARFMGQAVIDADKQAHKEATSGVVPNVELLKARLLFDGGYLDEALKVLEEPNKEIYKHAKEQLEYTYRLGRIYDQMNEKDKALTHYLSTIEQGANKAWYYAANSALHTAYIYESRKEYGQAKKYFNLCLEMKGHEYKNSIDQKAKIGLMRIDH